MINKVTFKYSDLLISEIKHSKISALFSRSFYMSVHCNIGGGRDYKLFITKIYYYIY